VAISSHGTTFAFSGIAGLTGSVLSISVEEAQPEIVDMTAVTDDIAVRKFMTTGDITSPPKVSIDYMRSQANLINYPMANAPVGQYGLLSVGHIDGGIFMSRYACVESASTEMAVGDFIRGKLTFVVDTTIPQP
jgi:hypothetical protein